MRVRIAVVDTGITPDPRLPRELPTFAPSSDGEPVPAPGVQAPRGVEAALAVLSGCPDADVVGVRAFDDLATADDVQIAAAIDAAVALDAQVIVIGIVSDEELETIAAAVSRAQAAGVHVVAPASEGMVTWPGHQDGVFRARTVPSLPYEQLVWIAPDGSGMDAFYFVGLVVPGGEVFDPIVSAALLGGFMGAAMVAGATDAASIHQALRTRATSPEALEAQGEDEELPFPELASADGATRARLFWTWSFRMVQPALSRPEADPDGVAAIRQAQIDGLMGDPTAWLTEVPRHLMALSEENQELATIVANVSRMFAEGRPEALSVLAGVARYFAQTPHEIELQERDVQAVPATSQDRTVRTEADVAGWLLAVAPHLRVRPGSELEAGLLAARDRGAPLPRAPHTSSIEAGANLLHTWLEILRYGATTSRPVFLGLASAFGASMAAYVPREELVGSPRRARLHPDDPRLPDGVDLEDLLDDVYLAEQLHRRMHWDVLDPALDAWLRRCLEAAQSTVPSDALDEVLATWTAGGANRMAARWPSLEGVVEPVAVPWIRAERALQPLAGRSREAALAWTAVHLAIDGGMYGDDDNSWVGGVLSLTSMIDPTFDRLAAVERLVTDLG
ncbi:MAG: hypothetical protein KC656_00020 [Myxococcales bacterium]|nr:hypothetical protein [Myxococcales bacterium]